MEYIQGLSLLLAQAQTSFIALIFFTRNVASKPLSQILSLPIFFRLQKLLEHYNCATVKECSIEHIPGSGSLQDVVLSPPYPESLF